MASMKGGRKAFGIVSVLNYDGVWEHGEVGDLDFAIWEGGVDD